MSKKNKNRKSAPTRGNYYKANQKSYNIRNQNSGTGSKKTRTDASGAGKNSSEAKGDLNLVNKLLRALFFGVLIFAIMHFRDGGMVFSIMAGCITFGAVFTGELIDYKLKNMKL